MAPKILVLTGDGINCERETARAFSLASAISSTYAELIKIDRPTFRAMVSDAPDFALMVMRVMARRLRIMNQRYRPQAAAW